MNVNVGTIDRIVRYALSFGLFGAALALNVPKAGSVVMAVFAGLLFCSATSRVCPVYVPFGITTCAKK